MDPADDVDVIADYEVVVIGCGIAGLCAGIRAAELERSAAILEIAPKERRGGETQYAGLIRVPSTDTDLTAFGYEFDVDYSKSDYYQDIMRVTRGKADPDLTKTLVDTVGPTVEWITAQGVEWQTAGVPAEHWQGTVVEHIQALGKHTIDSLVEQAEALGVDVFYDTRATALHQDEASRITGVGAVHDGSRVRFDCDAVVVACGGFESNVEKRSRYLGEDYDTIVVRGTRYNTGEPIDAALDLGAKAVGHWSGAHVTIIDAAAPPVEGGEQKVYGYPYAVLVNHDGERFLDEGEDMQTFTYAKFGREVFDQPDGEAFVLFDSKLEDHLYSMGQTDRISGDSIRALAGRLGIGDPDRTAATVEAYNDACDPGEFDPTRPDGNHTTGIEPAKSNWAIPIDEPPYYGYPVTAGITFTFGGLAIDTRARVIDTQDRPIPGLYAAGSSTGGIFFHNYPSGSEQANAAVFAKIAAEEIDGYLAG